MPVLWLYWFSKSLHHIGRAEGNCQSMLCSFPGEFSFPEEPTYSGEPNV